MIFSHVLYHLSYPAGKATATLILEYGVQSIKGWEDPLRESRDRLLCSRYFPEKRSSSKALSITSLGRAPTTALGCSPGSKRAMVGMLEMPKPPASSDSASTSILATFSVPSYSVAIWSITGAT